MGKDLGKDRALFRTKSLTLAAVLIFSLTGCSQGTATTAPINRSDILFRERTDLYTKILKAEKEGCNIVPFIKAFHKIENDIKSGVSSEPVGRDQLADPNRRLDEELRIIGFQKRGGTPTSLSEMIGTVGPSRDAKATAAKAPVYVPPVIPTFTPYNAPGSATGNSADQPVLKPSQRITREKMLEKANRVFHGNIPPKWMARIDRSVPP